MASSVAPWNMGNDTMETTSLSNHMLNSTTETTEVSDVINGTIASTLLYGMLKKRVHGAPLLITNPGQAIIYSIIAVSTSVLGLFGNAVIMVVFTGYKKLKVGCHEFIVNLALADIMALVIANPMCIIGALKGSEYLDTSDWLKDWVSSACLISCFSSLLNHTIIALTRYLIINHTSSFKKYTRNKILNIAGCIGVWVLSTLVVVGNFLSWGDQTLSKRIFSCMSDKIKGGVYYMVWIAIGLIAFCLVMTAFFYTKTLLYIWKTKQQVFSMGMIQDGKFSKPWIEIAKTSKSVFLVYLAFVLSWAPYALVVFIDLGRPLPFPVHLWVTWFSHFHSAFNFIIYWLSNSRFKEGYKSLFRNRVAPQTPETRRHELNQIT